MIASRQFFRAFVEETKLNEKLKQLQKELADTNDPNERARIEERIKLNCEKKEVVVNKLFRR